MDYLLISTLFASSISIVASIFTLTKLYSISVEVESFKKSTHQVQIIDTANHIADPKDEENLEKYKKEYQEEAREEFPVMATYPEDLTLKGL